MRRRVELAKSMLHRPQLLLLDEPSTGLDPAARSDMWQYLRQLRERDGVTIVLTTHLLDEAERVADRVAILNHGRLAAIGTPAELSRSDRPEITFTTGAEIDVDAFAAHVGGAVEATGELSYRVFGEPATPELVARITGWLSARRVLVRTLHVGARSLEEVYLELTR
jgi:ABC-2 type transport system ATP-binding protein